MSDGVPRQGFIVTAWCCPWCQQLHRLDVGPGVDLSKPRAAVCARCEKIVMVQP